MARAKITFSRIIQDSQDYGGDDEHMVSHVFLALEIGNRKTDLVADVKQIVGSNFEHAPLEVSLKDSKGQGYRGPNNWVAYFPQVSTRISPPTRIPSNWTLLLRLPHP